MKNRLNVPKATCIFLLCIFSACGKDIGRPLYVMDLSPCDSRISIVLYDASAESSDKTLDFYDCFTNQHLPFSEKQEITEGGIVKREIQVELKHPDARLQYFVDRYVSFARTVTIFSAGGRTAEIASTFEYRINPDTDFYGNASGRISRIECGGQGMDFSPSEKDSVTLCFWLDDNGLRMQ